MSAEANPLPAPAKRSPPVLVSSNLDGLSPHFRLLALDWLGTGLSGRPPYRAEGRQASEDFFVESLDKWRAKMGLDKFILMGHSLGGYLSACYALKHPEVRDALASSACCVCFHPGVHHRPPCLTTLPILLHQACSHLPTPLNLCSM